MDDSQIVAAIEKAKKGITQYLAIMDTVHRVDVSRNRDFQKRYNRFFRMRQRQPIWYKVYYAYLERSKIAPPPFDRVLEHLWSTLGKYEPSFSSKLVAILDPHRPIWDTVVLQNIGLKAPAYWDRNRVQKAKPVYRNLEKWYENYLRSDDAQRIVALFNQKIEKHQKLTALKKVDFVLWQTR